MEQKKRVLIADGSAKFCDELAQALAKWGTLEVAGTANDGEQAIDLIKSTEPDILVLDLMLPKKDGIEVLKSFGDNYIDKRSVVIATSAFITEYVASTAARLGVRYLMLKPFDMNVLVERILDLITTSTQCETAIVKCIRDIGIPAHIKGYQYLINAVKIAYADNMAVLNMTKKIYAPIAEMYNTTADKVRQAISRAIVIGWDRAELNTLESYFGYCAYNQKGSPTNAECVAALAERVGLCIKQQERLSAVQPFGKTTTDAVTKVLQDLSVPTHIKGYLYLHEAVCRCVEDGDLVNALSKVLYPVVAKSFNTTPRRVERAIRHAVEMAWDRGDLDTLQRFFGYTISHTKGKPTNSEFIAIITDDIRRSLQK